MYLLAYSMVRAVMAGVLQMLNAFHQQLRHSVGARVSVMIAHVLGTSPRAAFPVATGASSRAQSSEGQSLIGYSAFHGPSRASR